MPDCIKSYAFLSPEDSDKIVESVFALQEYWINRSDYFDYPFFTLGAASYLDAQQNNEEYYDLAKKLNPILENKFSQLYQKVQDFLEEKLGHKCIMAENQALPGFHIFLDDDFFEITVASRHVDLQFQLLNWNGLKFDPANNISFTVYIKMPSGGGGLYFWTHTHDDLKGFDNVTIDKTLMAVDPEFVKFNQGDLVTHTGLNYHQIAPMIDVQEGDQRISLQGHGILVDGVYHLYW